MATSNALTTTNTYINYTITVTVNSQNISNNTSNVTVSVRFYRTNTGYTTSGSGTVYCKINGTTYSADVTSAQGITNAGIVLFTKTLDIAHNSDGTKTLTTSAWISHSRFSSSEQSYNQVLTTIPRKSSLSVGNGTLGTAQTLTVSRATTSFTHTITYTCGSASGTIVSKSTSTSISFTPPLSLCSQNTTGTSVTITYTITTYNGNTTIGSSTYSNTYSIPSNIVPTVSFTVWEYTPDINDIFGVYVKGLSRLNIKATGTGIYGSTIKSYKITANRETFTNSSGITNILSSTGSVPIVVTVTDSRGRTGSSTSYVTVYDYNKPVIETFSGTRCNADGSENDEGTNVLLTLKGSVCNLSGNKGTYVIGYKKSSQTSYTYITLSNTSTFINTTYILKNIDSETTYDVMFTITDAVGNGMVDNIAISTAFTLVDYHKSGKSMAIGKVAEREDILDVALKSKFGAGFLYETIETNADFNVLTVANTYIVKSDRIYFNSPVNSVDGILKVIASDDNSTLSQTFTVSSKTDPITYERHYCDGSWGAWLNTSALKKQDELFIKLADRQEKSSGAKKNGETSEFKMQGNSIYLVIAWSHGASNNIVAVSICGYYSMNVNQTIIKGSMAPTISVVNTGVVSITHSSLGYNYKIIKLSGY